MIKFEEKDLKVKDEKLPTKAERKESKRFEATAQANKDRLRVLVTEFFNEKIVPLDIPLYEVEEHVPILFKTLLNINKALSTRFKEFLDAKKNIENTNICDLERYEED